MTRTTTAWTRGELPADLLISNVDAHTDVVTFLRTLATARTIPLSVPLAFNALAYRYDLQTKTYDSSLIDADRLPLISHERSIDALPVGAFARLAGGTALGCEIVSRHAEDPRIAPDGTVPSWLSGAPAGASNPAADSADPVTGAGRLSGDEIVLTERLIIDAAALDVNGTTRLRNLAGRVVTAEGHLLVHAGYLTADQADLDDTNLYLAHLLQQPLSHLRTLLAPLGIVASTDDAARTLTAVFDLLTLLLQVSGLYRWRDQFIDLELYDRWQAGNSTLTTADPLDVMGFARSTASSALPRQRRGLTIGGDPSFVAIGPAMRHTVTDPHHPDMAAPGLRGPQYAATLAYAQMHLSEVLERNGAVLDVSGQQVHLRLDDAWQGGGVWRAHVPVSGEHLDPADLPLSLGWFGAVEPPTRRPTSRGALLRPRDAPEHEQTPDLVDSTAGAPPSDEPPTEGIEDTTADIDDPVTPDAEAISDDFDEYAIDKWVDDTTLAWQFVLLPKHRRKRIVPLTPKVAAAMRAAFPDGANLTVDLQHPGTPLKPVERRQQTLVVDRSSDGFAWPQDMFVGMKLTASWSTDSYQVSVSSRALDEPVDVDGIPLDYAFDEGVVLRQLLAPVDLTTPDDVLSSGVLRFLLREQGRVGPKREAAAAIFVPFAELHRAATRYAQSRQQPPPTVADLYAAVTGACTDSGSVRVSWGLLLTQQSPEGPWLAASRWPCEPDRAWQQCDPSLPLSAADPAVVLSLHPQVTDRPSRRPATSTGLDTSPEFLFRRAHLMRVPRGSTPRQRDLAIQYARHMGWDPSTLDPRLTFVHASGTR